ncbi:two-component system response regulator YesN [Paenibacillus endophyticus]|uniref:Two-component system response regulator YesN n=1 Tax=Paenibacillus endophyticus TaxID=1294268 RepID=A0A7W5GDX6_9BACL|nr:helix-turn-helix domain-containing protein [Paenibacillus endophyticus]MBB3155918.1 two-component system response regulator YesN [Paenibacillus endophyticus]
MKLLIADDQLSLHRYLDKVMDWADLGISEVQHAYNGDEAANKIETFRPDLAIMDIHMPLLDGIESLRRIQHLDKIPRTIILSAYDQFEYARDALRLQVSHYLLKPVDAELLRDAIRELIQQSILDAEQSIRSELDRTIYSGHIEADSLKNFQDGLEFLSINHFAIMTFVGSMPSKNDYSYLLKEQAVIKIHCVMCCNNRKEQVVLIGGGKDLTNILLLEFCESVMKKAAGSTPPHTLSVGISSIAQEAPFLPQLIAESTRAVRGHASETISKLLDAVCRIKPYIERGYQEDLSLQSVADRFDIDKYQLSRTFKQEFGVNYWAYVTQVRMNKAAELLVSTNWRNNHIAEHTGFLDESHFSRAFKKHFGVTPKEYRASFIRPSN